jgi:hypothetical protein
VASTLSWSRPVVAVDYLFHLRAIGVTGERYHALPWAILKYDTRQGGYVIGLTIDHLRGAPTYSAEELPTWGDRAYETRIHDYYKAAPYWAV